MDIKILNDIIGTEAYWQVNKKIARFFKDNNTAVLLSDLISKQNYFLDRGETIQDGYFYNTSENIENDCNISYHKQKVCMKQLTDAGFLETLRTGLPAKLHFKINSIQILNFLNTGFKGSLNVDVKEFETNKNKANKNKEKRINNNIEFSGENLPNTNPEDLKYPEPKKANKGGASHQIVIDTYYEWFKNRNNGIKPKIDGAEAKAAKMLADYFRSLQMEFEPETLEEHLPEKVQKMFNRILNSWETLEPFLQKQVKLTQINSNITNIVNYLKNGKQATNNNYKQQPVTNDTIASRFTNFNKAFGTGSNNGN